MAKLLSLCCVAVLVSSWAAHGGKPAVAEQEWTPGQTGKGAQTVKEEEEVLGYHGLGGETVDRMQRARSKR